MHFQDQQISLVKAIDAVKDYAIFMLSPEGIVLSWNKGAERLKGYIAAEVVGQSFTCFYEPEVTMQGHPAKLLQLAQAQGSYEEEGWRLRKNGSRFWANVVITPIYNSSQELLGFTKVTCDLSGRLLSQISVTQLQHALERLKLTVKSARIGLWEWDIQAGKLYPDANILAYLDIELATFNYTHQAFMDRIYEADRECVQRALQRSIEQGELYDVEFRIVKRDGTLRYLAGRGEVQRDAHGQATFMLGINWDITEYKQLEEERFRAQLAAQSLHTMSNHLELALQAAKAGMWTWLIKPDVVTWDEATHVLFGLKPGEFDSSYAAFLQCVHPEDRQQVEQEINRSFEYGQIFDTEYRTLWPDGSQHWLAGRGSLILDEHQQPERLIGISWNIDERKKMEQRLHSHQAELAQVTKLSSMQEVASRLAHELNQPLMAIATYTQGCLHMLESEPERYEPLQLPLQNAAMQSARAGEIIHRMKNFVRSVNAFREIAELNTVIQESRALIIYEKSGYKVDIRCYLASGLPTLLMDKIQIQQVIINLLNNSIEAMQDNQTKQPTIWICSQIVNQKVKVSIRDNGPGIDPTMVDKLFSAYYTTKPYGMGLGLAICQSIIEAHGGSIICIPKEQGAHLEFTLSLR